MKPENIIELTGIRKQYDNNLILNDLDFYAKKSEIVSIIGPSGSGKTTFLRCLNLLVLPGSGKMQIENVSIDFDKISVPSKIKNGNKKRIDEANVNNKELRTATENLRKKIGFLSQYYDLFLHKTIRQGIAIAPRVVLNYSKADADKLTFEMLDKVSISHELADRYPHQISGGQRQRAAIARALAMKPDIMLYDEPTSAIDPSLIQDIADMMRQLKQEGMTQIIVTHSMKLARSVSDRILEMQNCKLVEKDFSDLPLAKDDD